MSTNADALIRNAIEGVTYADPADALRWLDSGGWWDMTIGDAIGKQARSYPDRTAFISEERTLTFAELEVESDRAGAALLALGLTPGERIIVQMGTTIETVIALAGMYKSGLIPVCAIPQYREREIGQLIEQSGAVAHVVQADFGSFDLVDFALEMGRAHPSVREICTIRAAASDERAADLLHLAEQISPSGARAAIDGVPLAPGDVLSFQLSGGTTGVPKIIPRFHGEYLAHSAAAMERFGFDAECRMIWPLPLLHNAGQVYAMIPAIALGSTTVIMPRLKIDVLFDMIERHRVTHAISVGPVSAHIQNYDELDRHDLSSLRLFATMSGARALEDFLGIPCVNLFGTTEGLLLGSRPGDPEALRHRSNGFSGIADDDIRLVDPETREDVAAGEDGELVFRGPSSLRGYFAAPEAGAEVLDADGFFYSGDIMRAVDVDGLRGYSFRGRTRDNVNRGGEKIGCEEVESLVVCHPHVAEARLVAMPDPIYGEKGCIFIVPKPGHAAPTVAALSLFLIEQGLAKFKCPERVETIGQFPTTRVGKLDRPALRARITEILDAEARTPTPAH